MFVARVARTNCSRSSWATFWRTGHEEVAVRWTAEGAALCKSDSCFSANSALPWAHLNCKCVNRQPSRGRLDENRCCLYFGFADGRDRLGTDIFGARLSRPFGGLGQAHADHSGGNQGSTLTQAGDFNEDS